MKCWGNIVPFLEAGEVGMVGMRGLMQMKGWEGAAAAAWINSPGLYPGVPCVMTVSSFPE